MESKKIYMFEDILGTSSAWLKNIREKHKEKIEDNEYLDFIVKSTESQIDNLSIFLEMVERDNNYGDESKSKSDIVDEEQYVFDSLTHISENLTEIKLSLPYDASEKENENV